MWGGPSGPPREAEASRHSFPDRFSPNRRHEELLDADLQRPEQRRDQRISPRQQPRRADRAAGDFDVLEPECGANTSLEYEVIGQNYT